MSGRIKVAVLVVFTVAVVALWGYLLTASPKGQPFSAPAALAGTASSGAGSISRVVVVGDGFAEPTASGGKGTAGWPQLTSSEFGWQTTVLANDGAGYLTRGQLDLALPATRLGVAGSRADLVLVEGGQADVGHQSAKAIGSAAGAFLAEAHGNLPRARIVVIGPLMTDSSAPGAAEQVRDALRASVATMPNAIFIDPLAENWFTTSSRRVLAPDGLHLTDAGQHLIAGRIDADLVRNGVVPPR